MYIIYITAVLNAPVRDAYRNAKAILGARLEIIEDGSHFDKIVNMKYALHTRIF